MRPEKSHLNRRAAVAIAVAAVLALTVGICWPGSVEGSAPAGEAGIEQSEAAPMLTQMLELSLAGARGTSSPPMNVSGKVTDLTARSGAGGTAVFAWGFRNPGDYNQDGFVNIQDLTPLAAHFNETADATNEWIDGNGDTVINIMDLTPLAANFFNVVSGYVLEHSPDGEEATYAEVLRDTVANMTVDDTGRLQLELTLDTPVYGDYYRVRPYDAAEPDNLGVPSDPVVLGAAGLVLKLSATTPAESGDGKTEETPYVILVSTAYELRVEDMQATDLSADAVIVATPPFFKTITETVPRTLTVTDELAGDFTVQASLDELSSNIVYFRVQQVMP